jgi:hypothetical protein
MKILLAFLALPLAPLICCGVHFTIRYVSNFIVALIIY